MAIRAWRHYLAFLGAAWLVFLGGVARPILADSGPNHQTRQDRPVLLGTSGGSSADVGSAFCCGGTLGALVQDAGGVQYLLSNNHVLARANQAQSGESIIQPGLIDQSPTCSVGANDGVAVLSAFVPIQFRSGKSTPLNQVDAAIAAAASGAVSANGSILDIGGISSNPLAAFLNQSVQKSGRTTGHTQGTVSALNVTVDIAYSSTCGGGSNLKARFVNQIRITPGTYSAGGDSGSLIVESGTVDPANGLPRAVGLLFAGSDTSTLANPIQSVLTALNVSLVEGELPPPGPNGSIAGVVTNAATNSPIQGALVSADTGQSATTDENGAYLLTAVPVGSRSVTAQAIGYSSSTQPALVNDGEQTTLDFALSGVIAPTQAIVQCVVWKTSGGPSQTKDLSVTLRIRDDLGNPVAGARVDIQLFRNGPLYGNGTGALTNSAGEATYNVKNASNGEYSVNVTNVVSNLTFEGSTPSNLFRKGVDASPDEDCRGDAPQPSSGEAQAAGHLKKAVGHAAEVKAKRENELFAVDGVIGTGVGMGKAGNPVVEVYLEKDNAQARRRLPSKLDDVETQVVVTGPFQAF